MPAGPPRPATINDVAAAVGVSRQTVTRAMNDMSGINAETKARVLAAAHELHYRPSRFGRGLVKPSQRTLGLIIDDLANPYYPELASSVVGFAAKHGWNVVVAEAVHATDRREQVVELARQVDAVVGYVPLGPGGSGPDDAGDDLAGLPVVRIDHDDTSGAPRFAAISLDPGPAMAELAVHLAVTGVRAPVALDASPIGQPGGRALHIRSALAEQGLRCMIWHTVDATVPAGARATDDLLADGPAFDAVVAFNDAVALGVLQSCRRHRIEVPGDVRVVGIDGLSIGTYVTPQLTTLALDMAEVARHAVELAVGMALGELPWTGAEVHRRVAHRLVVRESG